jgi:hypothetical protein
MRRMFYQQGSPSKYHATYDPHQFKWIHLIPPPYMFGRGWRKFRKHRFETT